MSHRHPLVRRAIAAVCAVSIAFLPVANTAYAGNHPLSAVADVNTIDFVANVDWDYDSPPTQVANSSQTLDRAYITSVLRVTAQSIFTMTEGLHRIGTVYVYRNGMFGDNVDIRLINKDGRSSASAPGWNKRDHTSNNHLAMDGNAETINQVGKVIAHELGHYTYGLFDEYVEEGREFNAADPGSPSKIDTPKNSIMNSHLEFKSLSAPADYADPAARQTAHYRIFGASQWETMARPASKDPEAARSLDRTSFEAFSNVDTQTLKLTQPVDGFDAKLNIVFVADPVFRETIVVDLTISEARLNDLIQGAMALVSQAKANTQIAIVALPASGDGIVKSFTATSIEGKQALESALTSLKPVSSGVFDPAAAFAKAREMTAAVRAVGDPATIHLLTGNEAVIPVEAATAVRTARIAVNPLAMTGGTAAGMKERRALMKALSATGTTVNLSELARQTGGIYHVAKNGADAAKDVINAAKQANADPYAVIHSDDEDNLAAGTTLSTKFRLASGTTDGQVFVEAFFDPADAAKLSFSLVDPSGAIHSTNSLPTGITFDSDAEEGVVEFSISPSFAQRSSSGVWTLKTTASAATVDGVAVEVSGLVSTKLSAEVVGGASGDVSGPALKAVLGGEKKIKGASVVATIYDESGKVVLSEVVMKDDGIAPDIRAGDGLYSLDLSNRLPAGEYFAEIVATTSSTSRTATLGSLIKGAIEEELPVELMQRVATVDFSLQSGTVGVGLPAPSGGSSGGGGGCTTDPYGRDASLLVLLGLAFAGWLMRRTPLRMARRAD